MTEEELVEVERVCEAATAGPWLPKYAKAFSADHSEHWVKSRATGEVVAQINYQPTGKEIGEDQEDRDLLFIARAREWVPALVAEVKRLRAAR